jgi:hypothetical protein
LIIINLGIYLVNVAAGLQGWWGGDGVTAGPERWGGSGSGGCGALTAAEALVVGVVAGSRQKKFKSSLLLKMRIESAKKNPMYYNFFHDFSNDIGFFSFCFVQCIRDWFCFCSVSMVSDVSTPSNGGK